MEDKTLPTTLGLGNQTSEQRKRLDKAQPTTLDLGQKEKQLQ
jgi:hypothetical protein